MSTKAERIKRAKLPPRTSEHGNRLPPGQVLTERFPILHVGDVPVYDPIDKWDLQVFGAVEQPRRFRFNDLLAMPQRKITCDIHCVTRWSKFDNVFEGIPFRTFMESFAVRPEATHVIVHGDYDYETNVPLEDLLNDNVLLAHSYNGHPLTEKHGFPLRLIVPHLYFWKSAKWLRGFEFVNEDRNGYWERNGFHHYGDPFREQRFSDEELEMPEDGWKEKEYDE
ncbi:MAG TPA: sulfite oxidase-like oxidoreductase [Bacillales bacterium]|nr:sulfite oxidase-like oxidoreductase [Bacillales bacterium]